MNARGDDFAANGICSPEGLFVADEFVGPQQVKALIECARLRQARGEFSAARMGFERPLLRAEIRGDYTCWLHEPLLAPETSLLADLEELRLKLNRAAFLGLFDLEMHYAWYPPGTGYKRHVDQPEGRADRVISLVLYLTEPWSHADGGLLRFFGSNTVRDVLPLSGRLVGFVSAGCEHAVLPTLKHRLSLTGWFRQRPSENGS